MIGEGTAYVSTDQLDGETDWKVREAIKFTKNIDLFEITQKKWDLQVDVPSD